MRWALTLLALAGGCTPAVADAPADGGAGAVNDPIDPDLRGKLAYGHGDAVASSFPIIVKTFDGSSPGATRTLLPDVPMRGMRWSADGTFLVYLSASGPEGWEQRVVNADGSNDHSVYTCPNPPGTYAGACAVPAIAPDNTLWYASYDGIYAAKLDGTQRLVFPNGPNCKAAGKIVFSRDGSHVAFEIGQPALPRCDAYGVHVQEATADSIGPPLTVPGSSGVALNAVRFSNDGQRIYLMMDYSSTVLHSCKLDGTDLRKELDATPFSVDMTPLGTAVVLDVINDTHALVAGRPRVDAGSRTVALIAVPLGIGNTKPPIYLLEDELAGGTAWSSP